MKKIDINCDLGESYGIYTIGNDEKIMSYITSANIACGFHAGDPMTIAKTVKVAKKHGVAVGAHPGFPDLLGFGRRNMGVTFDEAKNYTIYQIGSLLGFVRGEGVKLQHLKPHGAFYNMLVNDENLSEAVVQAVKAIDRNIVIFALPKSALARIAAKANLRVAHEFFADRAYNRDGTLVSRSRMNAVIQDLKKTVENAVRAVQTGMTLAYDGGNVSLGELHTICVHGDTHNAVGLLRALRKGLTGAKVGVESVGDFL